MLKLPNNVGVPKFHLTVDEEERCQADLLAIRPRYSMRRVDGLVQGVETCHRQLCLTKIHPGRERSRDTTKVSCRRLTLISDLYLI